MVEANPNMPNELGEISIEAYCPDPTSRSILALLAISWSVGNSIQSFSESSSERDGISFDSVNSSFNSSLESGLFDSETYKRSSFPSFHPLTSSNYLRGIKQGDAWATWNRPEQSRPGSGAQQGAWVYYRTYGDERIEVVAKQNEKKEWIILSVWSKPADTSKVKTEPFWQFLMRRVFRG